MNTTQKHLTWKYFKEQKKEEISEFFEENWEWIFTLTFLVGFFFQIGWVDESTIKIAIVGICLMGFWVLIGLIALIKEICNWIKSNWKKAKKRAIKELKQKENSKESKGGKK